MVEWLREHVVHEHGVLGAANPIYDGVIRGGGCSGLG